MNKNSDGPKLFSASSSPVTGQVQQVLWGPHRFKKVITLGFYWGVAKGLFRV